MHLNRRQFVRGCASSSAALMLAKPAGVLAACAGRRADVRITRIVGFDIRSKRNKVAGKNARLDVHGDSAVDPMVRIYTDADGVEGLGVCRASKERLAELLGRNPEELFDAAKRRMSGPLETQTMPLWDLVARMRKQQVCELLGAPAATGPRKVPAYDASIYFADLLPEHAGAWQDRFKREIDMGLEMGHRAFKVKVGRGGKWMPRDEGDTRDVEVLQVIRDHGGKDLFIGVDANNGYDLEGAKRFIDRTAHMNLAFVEEMFPEVVDQCLALKEHMRSHNAKTLLADGETQGDLAVFKPFVAAKAIDVLQGDMNRFGIEGMLEESDMARPHGSLIAPHNWSSLLGFYEQLHIGAAIDNFYRAEHDPLTTDVITAEGFSIKDGYAILPTGTGFGLRVNEERFAKDVQIKFDLKK